MQRALQIIVRTKSQFNQIYPSLFYFKTIITPFQTRRLVVHFVCLQVDRRILFHIRHKQNTNNKKYNMTKNI